MRFFDELKRRKVFQAAAGYAIVAWVVLQIGEVTFDPLHFPDWALTALVVAVIAGFPVVVMVSWFFDLTMRGWRKEPALQTDPSVKAAIDDAPVIEAASVAVLSFDDMSANRDQEYLCDGIAEEIINRLSQVEQLKVSSRTSSFRFKGQQRDIGDIARELRVRNILEGSIRKAGDRLRVTTQLICAVDGFHLWSRTYDRELHDIFAIEDDIATEVAEALQLTLSGASLPPSTTDNCKAYDHYLRGIHYFHRWGLRNVQFAIGMFERAVQIDPEYARAWAALADSHAMVCMYWRAEDVHLAAAVSASEKALKLAPKLAEAHVSRGLAHAVHCQHDEAASEFENALTLDSESFAAHYFYARVLFQRGDLERAAILFEKAEALRPDDFQAPVFLRQIYRSLGRAEAARLATERGIELARRHLELNPDDTRALNLGLGALAAMGANDEAKDWAARSLAIDGDNPDTLYNVACGYALMGEKERALDCLNRAGLHGMLIGEWAENDSDLASLHRDPRFNELVARLKRAGADSPSEGTAQRAMPDE